MSTISNLSVYYELAKESLAECQRLSKSQRRPKAGGEPGHIITYDPTAKSFKHALTAIVFSGIYLEALMFVEGRKRLEKRQYKKMDGQTYEQKLCALGITDAKVLSACAKFRKTRNDLVHEEAIDLSLATKKKFRWAQDEAEHALDFISNISTLLHRGP
ncbi:MAG: hypothetical protein V3W31_03495 [Thermodesulfobacteriota bacterium]